MRQKGWRAVHAVQVFPHSRLPMEQEVEPSTFTLDKVGAPQWLCHGRLALCLVDETLGQCLRAQDSTGIHDQTVDGPAVLYPRRRPWHNTPVSPSDTVDTGSLEAHQSTPGRSSRTCRAAPAACARCSACWPCRGLSRLSWLQGPSVSADGFDNSLTVLSCAITELASQTKVPRLSHLCELERGGELRANTPNPETQALISLVYSLIQHQLEQLL